MEEETSKSGVNGSPDVAHATHAPRSLGEVLYLGAIVLLALGSAVAFLLMAAYSRFVPAIGISFCFGLGIATLAYAFLGSKGHDRLVVRNVQLGGAVAVVVVLILVMNDPLERQMEVLKTIEALSQRAEAAENRARLAEEKARQELIIEHGASAEIAGGGRVALEDINTLNGWNEGPHSVNQRRPDAEYVVGRILKKLDIPSTAPEVLGMSETQWRGFVEQLPSGKRNQLGGIPFARLAITASDGSVVPQSVFKRDIVPVRNRKGAVEAYLCIRRVLDVRERRSDEPEIIVLAHGKDRCE